MIVIGSYAAEIGGFYPEWRSNGPGDIDLVCRRSEFDDFVTQFGEPRDLGADRYRWYIGGPFLDVTVHDDDLVALMESLSGEPVEVDLHPERLPVSCYVATPEIVWSTLYLTAGCAPAWQEKSWKDLKHYNALVELRGLITEDHWKIAKAYRRMMFDWITGALA
jgi:hypothetical protein